MPANRWRPALAAGENDQVTEASGAHVDLEPRAAAYLDDKVLDAQIDSGGTARFWLGVRRPGRAWHPRGQAAASSTTAPLPGPRPGTAPGGQTGTGRG